MRDLAKEYDIGDVAVIDTGYLDNGNIGRNVTIIDEKGVGAQPNMY